MRTHLRIAALVIAVVAGVQLLCAQYSLQVIQSFPENSAGRSNQVKFADADGDGDLDMIAAFSDTGKVGQVIGIWLKGATKFSDSVDCRINLAFRNKQCWFNVGDVNKDGKADIIAMSQYSSHHAPKVVFGRATWPKSVTAADVVCQFPNDPDYSSGPQYTSVVVDDFNDDGYNDFAFPDQGTSISLGNYGGRLVMYFGGATISGVPDMVFQYGGDLRPITLTGDTSEVYLRWFSPFISKGDFNGDGKMDIFTSGYYSYMSLMLQSVTSNKVIRMDNTGAGVVFFGGADLDTIPDVIMIPPNDFLQYTSQTDFMYCGYWVLNAGDINGDGADELSLPSWYWAVNFIYKGIPGMPQVPTEFQTLTVRDPYFYFTKDRYNNMGYADQNGTILFPVGDINGDHVPDLGNPRNMTTNGPDDPGVRLFFGKKTNAGSVTPDFVTADYSQVFESNNDFDGDGRVDLVMNNLDSKLCLVKLEMATAVRTGKDGLPTDFELTQNYPNPFNPSTTIMYQVPRQSQVTLRVYDVLGQLVETLVNEVQEPGVKTLKVDAARYSSGNYFYRMTAGGFTQTRMMTVVK